MDKADRAAWFPEARLGLFIHWGLYSLLGRGEWVLKRDGIPLREYAQLIRQWNPRAFTADDWCRAAVAAGMKYAVFTARHHDGFALFNSRADSFNSAQSPAKRDFVAEFLEACRKYKLRTGLYFSLADWRFLERRRTRAKAAQMRELA